MKEFIFGFFIGIISLWLTATNRFRFIIYEEKIKAYSEIFSILSEIISLIHLRGELNTEQKLQELTSLLNKKADTYAHIFPSSIHYAIIEFARGYDFDTFVKSPEIFINNYFKLIQNIKSDLRIFSIQNFLYLFFPEPKFIKAYPKFLRSS